MQRSYGDHPTPPAPAPNEPGHGRSDWLFEPGAGGRAARRAAVRPFVAAATRSRDLCLAAPRAACQKCRTSRSTACVRLPQRSVRSSPSCSAECSEIARTSLLTCERQRGDDARFVSCNRKCVAAQTRATVRASRWPIGASLTEVVGSLPKVYFNREQVAAADRRHRRDCGPRGCAGGIDLVRRALRGSWRSGIASGRRGSRASKRFGSISHVRRARGGAGPADRDAPASPGRRESYRTCPRQPAGCGAHCRARLLQHAEYGSHDLARRRSRRWESDGRPGGRFGHDSSGTAGLGIGTNR
jgi:hypothetical protein